MAILSFFKGLPASKEKDEVKETDKVPNAPSPILADYRPCRHILS